VSRRPKPATTEDMPRIRVLTRADRGKWIELRRQLWNHHSSKDLARDADNLLGAARGANFLRGSMLATVLLAETAHGEIVGFAEVDLRPYVDGCRSAPVGYLEGWYVAPAHRRRGVGRALVRAAERWARAQGCSEMASDTGLDNTVSQQAHRTLGYAEVERLVHFRRDLNGPAK